jgi:hypothetical protein
MDHLLTAHVAADELRRFAREAGITPGQVEAGYPTASRKGWASELTQSLSPAVLTEFLRQKFVWGNRALFDFPLGDEFTWELVQERVSNAVLARGDLVASQAVSGASTTPQIALVRRLADEVFLVVTDQLVPDYIDRLELGLEARMVPVWSVCAFTRRPGS